MFGAGVLNEIGPLAARAGKRAFLVTGKSGRNLSRVEALLDSQGIKAERFVVSGEPEVATVIAGVQAAFDAGCDLVISLGGGSVLDAGKAIAALMRNPGDPQDYLEVVGRGQPLVNPPAPFFAIPTTAGTGSEVTRNAVLAVPEKQVKVSLRSPMMLPTAAIVDPELTYDLPPEITAATGMDALTQLIEPYVSIRANSMTDLYCLEGIRRVARSLPVAFHHGHNKDARADMSFASLLGGLALANAGLGAVHGFAGPIGGMFPAPHGAVCAALLPAVVRVNARALADRAPQSPALQRYQEIARIVTGKTDADVPDLTRWLGELRADLGIPGLKTYGIRSEHLEVIAEKASSASSMKANPLALEREELLEILTAALE